MTAFTKLCTGSHEPPVLDNAISTNTVNPEIFVRTLFLRIVLKDIFATFQNRD